MVLTYWTWFLYIKYSGMEYPESEETAGEVKEIQETNKLINK